MNNALLEALRSLAKARGLESPDKDWRVILRLTGPFQHHSGG